MPVLPQGTVTFLFSDIEGSTRLLQRLGDRYTDVLADHQRLLRAAFQAADGHEVDTAGDSFFVAFHRATDAVAAAVAAQRAIATYPWPEDVQVRVRTRARCRGSICGGTRHVVVAGDRLRRGISWTSPTGNTHNRRRRSQAEPSTTKPSPRGRTAYRALKLTRDLMIARFARLCLTRQQLNCGVRRTLNPSS